MQVVKNIHIYIYIYIYMIFILRNGFIAELFQLSFNHMKKILSKINYLTYLD